MKQNEILSEKLTKVSADVDMLYNALFKTAFEYIKKTGKVDITLIRREHLDSSILTSKKAKAAHAVNPVRIISGDANRPGNSYNPGVKIIALNIHNKAWGLARKAGSIDNAYYNLPSSVGRRFKREFVPETIKGSIHHELNHWIDDSLNNNHIAKFVSVARDKGLSAQDNTGPHERNSQIHNIVQLKRILKNKWDTLSFEEMVQYIPSMGDWSLRLEDEEFKKWKRLLLRRMAREGLLGNNMGR